MSRKENQEAVGVVDTKRKVKRKTVFNLAESRCQIKQNEDKNHSEIIIMEVIGGPGSNSVSRERERKSD